jgi:hypothetical protein
MKKLKFTLLALVSILFLSSFSASAKETEGGSHSGGLGGGLNGTIKNTPFNNDLFCSNAAGSLKLANGRLRASDTLNEYIFTIQSYQQISEKQSIENSSKGFAVRVYYVKVLLVSSNIVQDLICEQPITSL